MLEALLFTKPTLAPPPPIESDADTVMLLHFDGTQGANDIIDEVGHVITAVNSAVVSTAQSKYGGSAGFFGATGGSRFTTPDAANLRFAGDFTIESFCYLTDVTKDVVLSEKSPSTTTSLRSWVRFNQRQALIKMEGEATDTPVGPSTALPGNQWFHFAVVKQGTLITVYVEGNPIGSFTSSGTWGNNTGPLLLGTNVNFSSAVFPGYIDEFRISKVARYTGSFTPPAARLPDPVRTIALLHMDGTNNSTVFTDETGLHTYTASSDAKISTTKSKFGGASLRPRTSVSTGTISTPSHPDFFFSGDFTVECWINADSFANEQYIFSRGTTLYLGLGPNTFSYRGGTTQNGSIAHSLPVGQWHHMALVRYGTDLMLFANGQLLQTKAGTTGVAGQNGHAFAIGSWTSLSGYSFEGYIDEFRITRGKALYTAPFTPPAAPFTL